MEMPNEIKVQVRWRHIWKGFTHYVNIDKCPITRALKEQFPDREAWAGTRYFNVADDNGDLVRYMWPDKVMLYLIPCIFYLPTVPFEFVGKKQ